MANMHDEFRETLYIISPWPFAFASFPLNARASIRCILSNLD